MLLECCEIFDSRKSFETSFPRYPDQTSWKFIAKFDDDIEIQMTSNASGVDNIWISDKKCLNILSPTSPYYFNVILISLQSVHFLSIMRHYTQGNVLPGTEE